MQSFHTQTHCQQVCKSAKVYSTRYSQAVTHPSTDRARRCLTSVIRREPVFSTWYGSRHLLPRNKQVLLKNVTSYVVFWENQSVWRLMEGWITDAHRQCFLKQCTSYVWLSWTVLNVLAHHPTIAASNTWSESTSWFCLLPGHIHENIRSPQAQCDLYSHLFNPHQYRSSLFLPYARKNTWLCNSVKILTSTVLQLSQENIIVLLQQPQAARASRHVQK